VHELSIAMSILDSLQEEVDRRACGRVEAVHVRIGALSGVVPEALQSAYEMASAETPFSRARLVIEEIPIVIYCAKCRCQRTASPPAWFSCPECNEVSPEIVSGRELEISSLEVST